MKIIVLEDTEARIDWLRVELRSSGAEIIWCPTVAAFLEASKADHDLVIFDHDLVSKPAAYSAPRPLDGCDAAHLYNPSRTPYALVWSGNDKGAQRIRQVLEQKNIPVTVCPFQPDQLEILSEALRKLVN